MGSWVWSSARVPSKPTSLTRLAKRLVPGLAPGYCKDRWMLARVQLIGVSSEGRNKRDSMIEGKTRARMTVMRIDKH